MDSQTAALRAAIRRAEIAGADRVADIADIRDNIAALPDQHRPFLARQIAARLANVDSDALVLQQLSDEYDRGGMYNKNLGETIAALNQFAADLQACLSDLLGGRNDTEPLEAALA